MSCEIVSSQKSAEVSSIYLGRSGTSGRPSCRACAAKLCCDDNGSLAWSSSRSSPRCEVDVVFSTHCHHFGKSKLQLLVVEYTQYAVVLSMGNTQLVLQNTRSF
jgi:hypothetical protein